MSMHQRNPKTVARRERRDEARVRRANGNATARAESARDACSASRSSLR